MLRRISKTQSARTSNESNPDQWLLDDLEAIGIYLRLDGNSELAEVVEGIAEQIGEGDGEQPTFVH